jgi:hypothetical protein
MLGVDHGLVGVHTEVQIRCVDVPKRAERGAQCPSASFMQLFAAA